MRRKKYTYSTRSDIKRAKEEREKIEDKQKITENIWKNTYESKTTKEGFRYVIN